MKQYENCPYKQLDSTQQTSNYALLSGITNLQQGKKLSC